MDPKTINTSWYPCTIYIQYIWYNVLGRAPDNDDVVAVFKNIIVSINYSGAGGGGVKR